MSTPNFSPSNFIANGNITSIGSGTIIMKRGFFQRRSEVV